ncbi:Extracellular solute-binding protein, family 3, partial [Candidatus Magnetomorum sp. HK-1]
PYLFYVSKEKQGGYAYDIIQNIFSRQKIKVNNETHNWTDCFTKLKNNEIDLIPNASFQKERSAYALYSAPIYQTTQVLFYSKKKYPKPPKINSLQDMKKYKFLGLNGHNYNFYNNELKIKQKAKSRRHQILLLHARIYDFAIAQKEVILFLEKLNVLDLSKIGWIPDPVKKTKKFHVLVNKTHPHGNELISIINKGMMDLEKSGQLKTIWDKNSEIR